MALDSWQMRVNTPLTSPLVLLIAPAQHCLVGFVGALRVVGKHSRGGLEHPLDCQSILLAGASRQRETPSTVYFAVAHCTHQHTATDC